MKYLILSDIHGNLEALQSVLQELKSKDIEFDDCVILGDLVGYGANPNEVVEQIREEFNPKLKFLGFVINLFMPRRTIEQQYYEAIIESLNNKLFSTIFQNHVQYKETIVYKQPITIYQPKSEQAQLYREFVQEFA